jgi:hypothetical protein
MDTGGKHFHAIAKYGTGAGNEHEAWQKKKTEAQELVRHARDEFHAKNEEFLKCMDENVPL